MTSQSVSVPYQTRNSRLVYKSQRNGMAWSYRVSSRFRRGPWRWGLRYINMTRWCTK